MKKYIGPHMFNELPEVEREKLKTMMVSHGVDWTQVRLIVIDGKKVTYEVYELDNGRRYLNNDGEVVTYEVKAKR